MARLERTFRSATQGDPRRRSARKHSQRRGETGFRSQIAFEASITIYLIWKAFKPSSILDDTRYAELGDGP